jgi:peptidoglycan/xylan/chitin deacetylase (PgdA/CDA1 family)
MRDVCRAGDHGTFPFLITVDDGGLSYYTVVADRLEALGWRGHCFVSTDFIGQRGFLDARQLRELDARGHVIGSHSASHPPRFTACTADDMRYEWSHSRQVLEQVLGHAVAVASVPGGYFSPAVAASAQGAGLRVLFTSEPTTSVDTARECTMVGRFAIRRGDRSNRSGRLVEASPWTRGGAWASWNVKGLIKPVLGSEYPRLADWVLADKVPGRWT